MKPTKKVLFLCTGNSCRSQIAEALVNAQWSARWQAFSAGTRPAGYVHPNAIQALAEIGIQHRGVSKHSDQYKGTAFDLVVTVCDSAAEDCPVWLGEGIKVHHSFIDPADAQGSADEVMQVFRQVRDQIRSWLPQLLADKKESGNDYPGAVHPETKRRSPKSTLPHPEG